MMITNLSTSVYRIPELGNASLRLQLLIVGYLSSYSNGNFLENLGELRTLKFRNSHYTTLKWILRNNDLSP